MVMPGGSCLSELNQSLTDSVQISLSNELKDEMYILVNDSRKQGLLRRTCGLILPTSTDAANNTVPV